MHFPLLVVGHVTEQDLDQYLAERRDEDGEFRYNKDCRWDYYYSTPIWQTFTLKKPLPPDNLWSYSLWVESYLHFLDKVVNTDLSASEIYNFIDGIKRLSIGLYTGVNVTTVGNIDEVRTLATHRKEQEDTFMLHRKIALNHSMKYLFPYMNAGFNFDLWYSEIYRPVPYAVWFIEQDVYFTPDQYGVGNYYRGLWDEIFSQDPDTEVSTWHCHL